MPETTPAKQPPGKLTWIHSDPRGLSDAFRSAYARAQRQEWGRNEESTADLRALLLYSFATMAALSPNAPRLTTFANGQTAWGVSPTQPAVREDSKEVQRWIGLGAVALMGSIGQWDQDAIKALPENVRVETTGGALPSGPTRDAGFPVVIGIVAIVSLAAGLASVAALYFSQTNEIEAVKLASDERVKKHAASLAAATNIVDAHLDREQATGTTLPWDEHETKLLAELEQTTKELAKESSSPLQSVPNVRAVTEGAGAALAGVGEAVKSAGTTFGLGGLALAGLGVWLVAGEAKDFRQRRAAA